MNGEISYLNVFESPHIPLFLKEGKAGLRILMFCVCMPA
jgi:hypothetical protein